MNLVKINSSNKPRCPQHGPQDTDYAAQVAPCGCEWVWTEDGKLESVPARSWFDQNEPITLAEAADVYGIAYTTLMSAVKDHRLSARQSKATWITSPAAIEAAFENGGLRK